MINLILSGEQTESRHRLRAYRQKAAWVGGFGCGREASRDSVRKAGALPHPLLARILGADLFSNRAHQTSSNCTLRTEAYFHDPLNDLAHVGCLRPFLSLDDLEFDLVALLQALIPVARDGTIVDKNVRSTVAPEEAVPLRIVEPLYRAFDAFHLSSLSLRFEQH